MSIRLLRMRMLEHGAGSAFGVALFCLVACGCRTLEDDAWMFTFSRSFLANMQEGKPADVAQARGSDPAYLALLVFAPFIADIVFLPITMTHDMLVQ